MCTYCSFSLPHRSICFLPQLTLTRVRRVRTSGWRHQTKQIFPQWLQKLSPVWSFLSCWSPPVTKSQPKHLTFFRLQSKVGRWNIWYEGVYKHIVIFNPCVFPTLNEFPRRVGNTFWMTRPALPVESRHPSLFLQAFTDGDNKVFSLDTCSCMTTQFNYHNLSKRRQM